MALDLSRFSNVSQNELSDAPMHVSGTDTDTTLITAKMGFKGKVLSTLSRIPLLKDLTAVQEHVDNSQVKNKNAVTQFLAAIRVRHGEDVSNEIAKSALIDVNGAKPLTERTVKTLMDLAETCVNIKILQTKIANQANPLTVKDLPIAPNAPNEENEANYVHVIAAPAPKKIPQQPQVATQHHQDFSQKLSQFQQSTLPKTLILEQGILSGVGNWLVGHSDPKMEAVQTQVNRYNNLLTRTNVPQEIARILLAIDPKAKHIIDGATPFEPLRMGLQLTVDALTDTLTAIEKQYPNLKESPRPVLIQNLYNAALAERDNIIALGQNTGALRTINQSSLHKEIKQFYNSLPDTLQSGLTTQQLHSCFDLFHQLPHEESQAALKERLSAAIYNRVDLPKVEFLTQLITLFSPNLSLEETLPHLKDTQQAEAALTLFNESNRWANACLQQNLKEVRQEFKPSQKVEQLTQQFKVLVTPRKEQQKGLLTPEITHNLLQQLDPKSGVERSDIGSQIINQSKAGLAEAAHQFLTIEQHLENQASKMALSIALESNQGVTETALIKRFKQDPSQYITDLETLVKLNTQYIQHLEHLITQLPKDDLFTKVLQQKVTDMEAIAQFNKQLLTSMVSTNIALSQEIPVIRALKRTKAINQAIVQSSTALKRTKAQANQAKYIEFTTKLKNKNNQLRAILTMKAKLDPKNPKDQQAIAIFDEGIQKNKLEYHKILLELKQFDTQAPKLGSYPHQGDYNSLDAWQSWAGQTFAGELSPNYQATMQELILERQLANNNMSSITEAYSHLYQQYSGGALESIENLAIPETKEMVERVKTAVADLHAWAMNHPIEARELAGDLTQVYNIISSSPGTFGTDFAKFVKTSWQIGTVENQVTDVLLGKRALIPSEAGLEMTPEMIALLHMARIAPYVAGGAQGASGQGLGAHLLTGVAGHFIPGGKLLTGAIGGIMEVKAQKLAAQKVVEHRDTEVMVNALLTAIQGTDGLGLKARTARMSTYMAQRNAVQSLGTVNRDVFEVGAKGTATRFVTDMTNWWQFSSTKAKVATLAITATSIVGMSAAAVGFGLLTVGTGGAAAIILAAILGVGGATAGIFTSQSLLNWVASLPFADPLGLKEAQAKVKEAMTEQRLNEALKQIKLSKSDAIKALNIDANKKAEMLEALNKESESTQGTVFQKLILQQAQETQTQLDNDITESDPSIIRKAQEALKGYGFSAEQLQHTLSTMNQVFFSTPVENVKI
ncbi:type III secretion system effector BopA family protein [uncultured Shewanella sp.]|uniref:type III secretion system effector BopA family protein n=1 Tax=uncultured Shewanella sp. TaxID=173975 RepID=UPI0026016A37|nr:type III secretion system effector BopA family protein [uncultured Shewanella sp.]